MGTTTFTGPIKAGDVLNTTGSSVGQIANVGYVVMAQSSPVTQASGATSIVIPKNSQILSIDVMVTTVWDGAATTFGVGTTDRKIAVTSTNTGAGVGVITVTYLQARNLTA